MGSLPAEAEKHGMARLLYHHLCHLEAEIPQSVRRFLVGLNLKHRHAYQVRRRILTGILERFEAEGITALLLKGMVSTLIQTEQYAIILNAGDGLRRAERHLDGAKADLPFPQPLPCGPYRGTVYPGKVYESINEMKAPRITCEGLIIPED